MHIAIRARGGYIYLIGRQYLQPAGDKKMKDFKVTVTGETGSISYEVRKTARSAESFGKKVAAEAFYGESCTIEIVEIA